METKHVVPGVGTVVARRIESPLGCWNQSEWRPAADHPLAWAVERVWDFEGRLEHRSERVFPSGHLELIVQLDDPYHDVIQGCRRVTPASCVTGIQGAPIVVEAPDRPCRVIGVRFHPPGAFAVLHHPLSELTGLTADLRELVVAAAEELAGRCHDAGSPAARVHRAVAWLERRLHGGSESPRPTREVQRAYGRIRAAEGAVRIATVREDVGLRTGRLTHAFLEQVGVTPKRFARILRFRRALELLRDGSPLSEVALRAGYYDQPHMNREFRQLAGLPPRQLHASVLFPASTSIADA
jgi:AraC-like DNA-binding protein